MLVTFNQWLNENNNSIDRDELKRLITDIVLGNAEILRFTKKDADRLLQIIESNSFIKTESLAFLKSKGVTTLWRGIDDDFDPEWDEFELNMTSFTYDREVAESFSGGQSLIQVRLDDIQDEFLLSIEWVSQWLGIEKLSSDEFNKYRESDGWNDEGDLGFRGMVEDQFECLVKWPDVAPKCELVED
jgi:hypothetical protein